MNDKKPLILIVDDEKANLTFLNDILSARYDVQVAKNGKTALKRALSDNPPDLILLDVMMPDMDGYDVCAQLKSDDATKHIPIIFITGMDQVEDEAKGLALGAADYVSKPVSPPILINRIEVHLELRRLKCR